MLRYLYQLLLVLDDPAEEIMHLLGCAGRKKRLIALPGNIPGGQPAETFIQK